MFVNDQLSSGFVGFNATCLLPVGTSNSFTLNTLELPLYVTQIVPEIYYGGTLQDFMNDTGIDKVTMQVSNPQRSNAQPFNTAVSLSQWYRLGMGEKFQGFFLPANTSLTFNFTHTAQNWATASTSLDISVAFAGVKGTVEELRKYFLIDEVN